MRSFLSALGIAIGIAAVIAVVGVSESSRAELNAQLDRLGTNLLRVAPGTDLMGEQVALPDTAAAAVGMIPPVESVTAVGKVDAKVYRSDRVPPERSGSIAVLAVPLDLRQRLGLELAGGTWLNRATSRYPAVVLGSESASRLGVGPGGTGEQVWLGGEWFTVAGVLDPVPLAPELDTAALVGAPIARDHLGHDGSVSTIYVRADPGAVKDVRSVLAATANPESPSDVQVSRPSDALTAQEAVDSALRSMLLGLGGVSLLVGAVGVANTMVISVIERRSEIGLRRALGATRGAVRAQFLVESSLLSLMGGLGGVLLGSAVTAIYALLQGWSPTLPLWSLGGALAAAVGIGALAGLYPAARAARLAPTEALAAN
ncbi:ABC transporter permease [Nocardiopsis sp. CNT-189]|uniref:ABC transporter permease n=1 Tax=Nocardiopsis oceanisediminis TaxID=2816862 RepID=UPI003B3AF913